MGFEFQNQNDRIISERAVASRKKFHTAVFMINQATQPELAFSKALTLRRETERRR